jgi:hypothetical protein
MIIPNTRFESNTGKKHDISPKSEKGKNKILDSFKQNQPKTFEEHLKYQIDGLYNDDKKIIKKNIDILHSRYMENGYAKKYSDSDNFLDKIVNIRDKSAGESKIHQPFKSKKIEKNFSDDEI